MNGGGMPIPSTLNNPSQSLIDARNNLVGHIFAAPKVSEIFLVSNDLECKCPETGMQDEYDVIVRFQPGAYAVEKEAFLLYVHAFQDEALMAEDLAEIIVDDMEQMLRPLFVEIMLSQVPTNGLMLSVRATRGIYQIPASTTS
jgi:NADPH-dependent 7-cyano-7-deazaguanine reductase QueF